MSFKFGTSVQGAKSTGGGRRSVPSEAGFQFSQQDRRKTIDVKIGQSGRQTFGLSSADRQHHTHVIGSTGTGKSKFIELLVRHDLESPEAGLCLLDPHGSLYEDVLHYVAHERPDLADRLVLFNPAQETDQVIGFNPVVTDSAHLDYLLDSLISACLKAWGQDNTDRTPRITKWLENIFYTVMVNDLTMVEAAPLMSIQNKTQREILLRNVHSDMVLDDWRMFDASTNTQKQALIEGAANRLRKFLRNGLVRNIIGQKDRVLDFGEVMAQGKIVLVNLNGRGAISHENTKLLGILLVNEIFRCAKLRDPRDPNLKPFYFYIDEFAQFITRDIARALEEARKFKLFMVLAHQHLAQLREEDEYLYASVLTNCKNKVVFGGLSREDAQIMTDEVSSGFVNLKAVKDELYSTKARQRLELRKVRNTSQGSTSGTSITRSKGQTFGTSESHSHAFSAGSSLGFRNEERSTEQAAARRLFGLQDGPSGWTQSQQETHGHASSTSQSQSETTSHGSSHSTSTSQGESETWVSVNEEYQELSSRTFWSLQELEYLEMAKLKNQGVAQAYIKLWGDAPKDVAIARVETHPYGPESPDLIAQTRARAIAANGSYYTALDQVERERHARQMAAFGEPLRFSNDAVGLPGGEQGDMIDADDPFT
ncbi:MAG: type IV secretory system conjugative DNA transfer family protein [Paracoccaceae bacterium]